MTIYLGPKNRNKVLLPQNRGFSEIAQRKLEQTVGMANRAAQEAINTDGYRVRVWKRQSGSIRCTCNLSHDLSDPKNLDNDALPHDPLWQGHTNEQTIKRVQAPPQLGQGPLGPIILRDSGLPFDSQLIPDTPSPDPEPDNTSIDFDGTEYEFEDQDYHNDELQRRHIGNLQRHILGVQKFRCAICFGTSYTDTYLFASGRRYILDASGHFDFDLGNASLDVEGIPNRFELSGDSSVSWKIQVPTWFETISNVRIFNGFEPALGVKAEFQISGTADPWQPLSISNLTRLRGVSSDLNVRVVAENPRLDSPRPFTHVEIYYETTKLPKAQIPQLNRSSTLFSPEDIISIEAEIDPIVGLVRKESILEIVNQGTLWKIGNITNRTTANRQLFGYQLEMTLVHASEQISAIRVRNFDDIQRTDAVFAGLERKQGSGTI